MKMNVGVRVGGKLQRTRDNRLPDFGLDTTYVEPRFSGQVVPMLSWQANFNVGVGGTNAATCVGLRRCGRSLRHHNGALSRSWISS